MGGRSCRHGHGLTAPNPHPTPISSGSPLWLQHGTPEASAAGTVATANGFAGGWPAGGSAPYQTDDPLGGGGWLPMGTRPVVAVGLVSRGRGACPDGPDCVNLAAPLDERAITFVRNWVAM